MQPGMAGGVLVPILSTFESQFSLLLPEKYYCIIIKRKYFTSQLSRKYKFHNPDKLYFVTLSVVYWIDLFIRAEYKDILIDSWKYGITKKGMQLFGYCIMTVMFI